MVIKDVNYLKTMNEVKGQCGLILYKERQTNTVNDILKNACQALLHLDAASAPLYALMA